MTAGLNEYDVPTPAEFREWCAHAHPGQRTIYHEGYLVRDRSMGTPAALAVSEIAKETMRLAEQGEVHLTQVRLPVPEGEKGPRFRYVATRRPRRRR